jgi:hypothetical protein
VEEKWRPAGEQKPVGGEAKAADGGGQVGRSDSLGGATVRWRRTPGGRRGGREVDGGSDGWNEERETVSRI